ncbi:hypothetical protein Acr_08g0012020 [Actinidia rufa]|uniref:Uncharacterized protein n=1 Tax=Actinidia rufa TaxID=165716 RepID=A0A7J0F322_9ERIC|nr:hypothetical protein Acr_08g0012020 [Actinidia rufa]
MLKPVVQSGKGDAGTGWGGVVWSEERVAVEGVAGGVGDRKWEVDEGRNEHDKIRELSQQLTIERKRAAMYKRHLEMIFEHIEEHNESLSKKIQNIVDSVRDMESEGKQSHR